jgi:hypothetical protein
LQNSKIADFIFPENQTFLKILAVKEFLGISSKANLIVFETNQGALWFVTRYFSQTPKPPTTNPQ